METRRKASFPRKAPSKAIGIEVNPKEPKILNKRHQSSSLTVECYNFTGQTIKTLDNLGFCTVHRPITTSPDEKSFIGCFVIKRINTVSDSTQIVDMSDTVKGSRYETFNEEIFSELLIHINQKDSEQMRRRASSAVYTIPHTNITKNGGSIYVRDVDLVIVNDKFIGEIIHPNSPKAIDLHIEQLYSAAHTYSIEINDPVGGKLPFYINLNDKVFEIQPTQDESLGEEVRIVFKAANQPAETIYLGGIDDEALSKIGIFRNYRDADKYGEKLTILKNQQEIDNINAKAGLEKAKVTATKETIDIKLNGEYEALDLKLKELTAKQEMAEKQHQAELDKRDREREEARRDLIFEREKAEMLQQQLRMKDHYDYRSAERKDASEGLKFLPVVVGGALALFALMK